MNERIKELMPKPWVFPYPDREMYSKEQFEKFAELIVRECMKLNHDILCEDDPNYLDQVYKEHFGVKE